MKDLNRKIFYITNNNTWGGSELLWYQSVEALLKDSYEIGLAIKYNHPKIDELKSRLYSFIDINKRIPLPWWQRGINKIFSIFHFKDSLREALIKYKPDLVVISQGTNNGSEHLMGLCIELGCKYVVLTHLVADINWITIDNVSRAELIKGYKNAVRCFFVSKANIALHNFILGYQSSNAEVVYNPVITQHIGDIKFPDLQKQLNVAIVGRIECFHKGLDLLLEIVCQDKWQQRAIVFNLYGEGPHTEIIKDIIRNKQIKNIFLHGFNNAVTEIWKENHLLLLPSRMEGQSVSLSEALSLNRTVVATNVGGVGEYITDNETGFLANSASVSAIDEALERAWNRRLELEEIGKMAGAAWRSIVPLQPVADFNEQLFKIIGY